MIEERRPSDELRDYLDREDADAVDALATRLEAERPTPRAGFRAELRARLLHQAPGQTGWRPRRLRLLVASYVGSGLTLLLVAAVGLAGAGPLGY